MGWAEFRTMGAAANGEQQQQQQQALMQESSRVAAQQAQAPRRSLRALPNPTPQEVQWMEGIFEDDADTELDANVAQHVVHAALGSVQELRAHLLGLPGLQAVQQLRDGVASAKGAHVLQGCVCGRCMLLRQLSAAGV